MAESAYYAPRSMVAYKISFNRRGRPDEVVPIDAIDGTSVGDLFFGFCQGDAGRLQEAATGGKYLRLFGARRIDDGVMAKLLSGLGGEERQVYDIKSAEKKFDIAESDASMVTVRCFLSWKRTGRGYAILCVEHASGAAGDTVLFRPFRSYLRSVAPNVVVDFEPVVEAEALESFSSLEEVEVKRYLEQGDLADRLTREGDYVAYKLGHMRGRPFGIGFVKELLTGKSDKSTLLGLRGTFLDSDRSVVSVSLKDRRGAVRKFELGESFGMKVREVLNDAGSPPVPDDEFIEVCEDRCATIAEKAGRMI